MKEKGFTLIELLIVVAILGIMSNVLYCVSIEPIWNFKMEDTRSFIQLDSDNVQRMLGKDIRNSRGIYSDQNFFINNESPLVLKMDGEKGNEFSVVRYRLEKNDSGEENILWRESFEKNEGEWVLSSDYPVSRNIQKMYFQPEYGNLNNPKSVKVIIGYSKKAVHKVVEKEILWIFSFRRLQNEE